MKTGKKKKTNPSTRVESPTEPPKDRPKPQQEHQESERRKDGIELLKNVNYAAYMSRALGNRFFDCSTFVAYLDDLKKQIGEPEDPVEVMMMEELAFAHFQIGDISAKAAEAGQLTEQAVYYAAAARLLGEFRRLAESFQRYRQKRISESDTTSRLKIFPDAG